ncbi:chromodomain Y-like protein [Liolophura sinensis]|uniref:chromodomain Y-like protein n=1 Tax=Liolophura sinensis TaxID=3198878 RepID=UPI003158D67E
MSGSQGSDQEFEVDRILDHRKQGAKSEYLIRWKDFGPEDDSWEPVQNLTHCRDLVEHYNRVYLSPVTPGSSTSSLSRLGSLSKMPAKVSSRSRSRSSSRSRSKKSSSSPSRSPSRKSSRTSTVTKEVVTKRSGRSPNRSVRSSASSQLTRSPVKEASFSQRSATKVVEETTTGRQSAVLEQRQVHVQHSWTSTSAGIAEIRGRRQVRASEMSDSDEEVDTKRKVKDEVDAADTQSWFGQKRREMLESLQSRSSSSQHKVQSLSEPRAIKETSGWSFTTYRPMAKFGVHRSDIPIVVFVACLVVIGITFLIEEYF